MCSPTLEKFKPIRPEDGCHPEPLHRMVVHPQAPHAGLQTGFARTWDEELVLWLGSSWTERLQIGEGSKSSWCCAGDAKASQTPPACTEPTLPSSHSRSW